MLPETIFDVHLVLGYVAWLLCFGAYIWPWLKRLEPIEAQRAITTLHSFRFFGLIFVLPGVVGTGLPMGFGPFAAYADFATGVLAMLALLTIRIRSFFWLFAIAFNLVGAIDILVDYYHGITLNLGAVSGQLGAGYFIPIIYVPLLMITHAAAFYLMVRPQARSRPALKEAVASSN